ncbi:hypothetical protein [Arthrobacter sp. H14-L1]|uniref:hypothetical protein n=1 Tax=Arthrobacter sp. H14-L1 TaxID=2996697 RepID=UPI002D1E44C5|nr:hypothetical protein [Arthrobacter sp. H14-L1]
MVQLEKLREGVHNGLRGISSSLGSQDYYRFRVGVGRAPSRSDAATHVLEDFSSHRAGAWLSPTADITAK